MSDVRYDFLIRWTAWLGFFFLTCAVSDALTTVEFVVSADTQIVENRPDTVFGRHHSLAVTNFSPYRARALYRFDLNGLPDRVAIVSASLRLQMGAWGWGAPLKVTGHSVLAPWDETTTTWNAFGQFLGSGGVAGVDYQAEPAFVRTFTAGQGANNTRMVVDFDMTALVRRWHEDPSSNLGVYLTDGLIDNGDTPNSIRFFMSRKSWMGVDTYPRLVVTYLDLSGIEYPPEQLRVFLVDADAIASVKSRVADGDENLAPAVARLLRSADRALQAGPFSVVYKPLVPPSGNMHDYMSMGPYWWPNPDTPDGLPYVWRDGERNPEADLLDQPQLSQMISSVNSLALAYYLTEHQPYADRAAMLLRAWFFDEETYMNPHLQYAQGVPGVVDGREYGIIDARDLVSLLDSVGMLAGSNAWTLSDQEGLYIWFYRYLEWLRTSQHGRGADATLNNHATWYDVQVAGIALFVGRESLAQEVLELVKTRRIATQIEPDGRQPHELERTRSLSYTVTNLRGMINLATMAELVDIDLWAFETQDGRGIRKAIDWLYPFAIGQQEWEYEQISDPPYSNMAELYRRAAIAYVHEPYETVLYHLPDINLDSDRRNLLYPKPDFDD